jgi:hypothetical protein
MPRTYHADKKLAPLVAFPAPASPAAPLQPWTDGQLLHDLKSAAPILKAALGSGYSYTELRNAIRSGQWQEGIHWWKKGNRYKVNLHRIIEWQLHGSQ